MQTRLQIEAGARLDWLPQETIVFDGAALDRRLSVEMAPDARFLLCEPLIFGRAAMGERVTDLRHADRIDIRRGGKLVWADRLRLFGDAFARLADPAIARGAQAMATVVLAAPALARASRRCARCCPKPKGCSPPVSRRSTPILLCCACSPLTGSSCAVTFALYCGACRAPNSQDPG